MGSSTSKPRKGHKNPKHLPKVGSPENLEWRHEGARKDAFGSGVVAVVVVVVLIIGLVGWMYLT